jgi:hypothetical protein
MGFDWSRLQGLGTLSEKATKDVADGFSDEDKRAIMDGAHQEMADAKEDMWALVEHYMTKLVDGDRQSTPRDSQFFGLWSEIAREHKSQVDRAVATHRHLDVGRGR